MGRADGVNDEQRPKDSLENKCCTWRNGRFHIVMQTQVGIHVFSLCLQQRRGWPAFADHDEIA
jgi:hypothetical protein